MDNTTYEIEVFRDSDDPRFEQLSRALVAEIQSLGLHRTVNVAAIEFRSNSELAPSIGVYLSSPKALANEEISSRVEQALKVGQVVIPVVDDLNDFTHAVPEVLRPINGCPWTGEESALRLARLLLEELGIEESKRKVFISHKREDGLMAAEQLRDALAKFRFDPFIDRFNIHSGENVQAKIADQLEDHAFMLLLETPQAHTSAWVFDEVDYALSHTMGILILRWPGDHPEVPGSPGVPRFLLKNSDLQRNEHEYDLFTEGALDQILGEIEAAHARGLVRRRKNLIRSIEEAAANAGCLSTPLPHWRLKVECPSGDDAALLGITPRLPTATDLQHLDQARNELGGDSSSAVLVHAARSLRGDLRDHLRWVAGERELVVMPENAIGSQWTP